MFDDQTLRGHVLVPIALFERMAHAYYGGGMNLQEQRADRAARESAKVSSIEKPPPEPEHIKLERSPTVRMRPQGAAARAQTVTDDGDLNDSANEE